MKKQAIISAVFFALTVVAAISMESFNREVVALSAIIFTLLVGFQIYRTYRGVQHFVAYTKRKTHEAEEAISKKVHDLTHHKQSVPEMNA